MANTTTDRRARHTRSAIKEAFYNLLARHPFSQISVTSLCAQAIIGRGTFYLHYEDKYALARELIDEALDASEIDPEQTGFSDCRRIPKNERHRMLYLDKDLWPILADRIIERNSESSIAEIMERAELDRNQAKALFVYIAWGNFAVNHMLGWRENELRNSIQDAITAYHEGGMESLSRLLDPAFLNNNL